MTGDETENVPDPKADAATAASAPGGEGIAPPVAPGVEAFDVPAPETVAAPDAEAAIEEFEVPPPPTFGAAPSSPAPESEIPPSPSEDAAGDDVAGPALRRRSTWTPDDTWTSESAHRQEPARPTAAQKAESRAAASRAATARDEATRNRVSPAEGGTEGNSYRGWTVTIYAGLAVLLFGAIGFMVVVGFPGLPA